MEIEQKGWAYSCEQDTETSPQRTMVEADIGNVSC